MSYRCSGVVSQRVLGRSNFLAPGVPRWRQGFLGSWSLFLGLTDPVNCPHTVYCHVCQLTISIKSRGHHDIVRHWKRERHFRKEQLYRDVHWMEVLDRDRVVLTGQRLERERLLFRDAPEFELGLRYPFYSVVTEDSPVIPEDLPLLRTKIQLQCIVDVIASGDQISTLRSVWRIVAANLPMGEVTAEIDFGDGRVVCLIQFLCNSLVKILRDSVTVDNQYGLVFEDTLEERRVHLCFCSGDTLMYMLLLSRGRFESGEHLDLLLLSRVFSPLPEGSCPVSFALGRGLMFWRQLNATSSPRLASSPTPPLVPSYLNAF